jgi:predicted NAD-dependent protein-ADP-ribosyltransferase YbiA (DUF1768 family)
MQNSWYNCTTSLFVGGSAVKFSKNSDNQARVLSMYYGAPILYKGQLFNSAIHLLSWHKCTDPAYRDRLMTAHDPMQAGFYGSEIGRRFLTRHNHGLKYNLRANWQAVHRKTVWKILHLKADQNSAIMKILLDTRDQKLIENDSDYWETPIEPNLLGKLWMKIRSQHQT